MNKLILLATMPMVLVGCHDSSAQYENTKNDSVGILDDYCPRHIDNTGDREFTFQEEIEWNTDIFIGTVETVKMYKSNLCEATFHVERPYKISDNSPKIAVKTNYGIDEGKLKTEGTKLIDYVLNPNNCPYKKGSKYLVFAKKARDSEGGVTKDVFLSSPGCNSSQALSDASQEIQVLNERFKNN